MRTKIERNLINMVQRQALGGSAGMSLPNSNLICIVQKQALNAKNTLMYLLRKQALGDCVA